MLTLTRPTALGAPTGDDQLTSALASRLRGHRRVAIAYRDGAGGQRFGGFGADARTEFEIGSVSKTFTGALLAEAVARQEVTLDTTVAEVLGAQAAGSAIADVTLAELTTHTSGIPRLSAHTHRAAWTRGLRGKDPYAGRDAEQVLADALGSRPRKRGSHAYSNLAVALEGQLLARVAGTNYASLLVQRILAPLGMDDTYAPLTPEALRGTATRGRSASGSPQDPWTLAGSAPAGGIRSTAADMAAYLAGMLEGTAPGAAAPRDILVPQNANNALAMHWFRQSHGKRSDRDADRPIAWHSGMTGGYAAFIALDLSTDRGLVLLSDTARSLDAAAKAVLTAQEMP